MNSAADATAPGHLLAVYLMSEGVIYANESERSRLRLLRRQVRMLTETRHHASGGVAKKK